MGTTLGMLARLRDVPGCAWPAAIVVVALGLCLTSFTVEPAPGGTPFGAFHLWDVPAAFGVIVACGIIAAALAAHRSPQVAHVRSWVCVALVAAMIGSMSSIGPGMLVSGNQQITGCYQQHGCIVDRSFPGAKVVSQDPAMTDAIRRSNYQAALFASPWWTIATWLMFLGAFVGIYRLVGAWADHLAALTGAAGTAMLFVSFAAHDSFLLETIAQLFFPMLAVELLATITLTVRRRWLHLGTLVVLGFAPVILVVMALAGDTS